MAVDTPPRTPPAPPWPEIATTRRLTWPLAVWRASTVHADDLVVGRGLTRPAAVRALARDVRRRTGA